MGVLSDTQIRNEVRIYPFTEGVKRPGKISYGVSSYGYDCRLGYNFKVFHNVYNTVVDPKDFKEDLFTPIVLEPNKSPNAITIPPNSFVLGESLETFDIPRDVLAICVGKSTYARCGIIVNVTPLEPQWRGKVTIEISNTSPQPAALYPGEGIMQVIFLRADNICQISYADKAGKYQDQKDLTLPKVDKEEP